MNMILKKIDIRYREKIQFFNRKNVKITFDDVKGKHLRLMIDEKLYELVVCELAGKDYGYEVIHVSDETCPFCGKKGVLTCVDFDIKESHRLLRDVVEKTSFRLENLFENTINIADNDLTQIG